MRVFKGVWVLTMGVALSLCCNATAWACWTCETVWDDYQQAWAHICVSVGLGSGGWMDCEPFWDYEYPSCKMSGGTCVGDGGWRPPRYPVFPVEEPAPGLTTRVLLLAPGNGGTALSNRPASARQPEGLEPLSLARHLAGPDAPLPILLAYSEESHPRMTLSRYRAEDGSAVVIRVHRQRSGFIVAVTSQVATGTRSASAAMFVQAGELAILPAEIAGRSCSIVVSPVLAQSANKRLAGTPGDDGDAFRRAVEAFPDQGLLGLTIDRPSPESTAGAEEALKAMTTGMLFSGLIATARR